MTNKSTQAVVSDVDGTLIDSTYFHAVAWWLALRQSGITIPTATIHRAVGMRGQELLHHFLGSDTTPEQADALIEAHDAIFSTRWPALVPFAAAKELLEHCAASLDTVGSDPAHACFIGDAVRDAQAAGALGLLMLGVCSGGSSEAELCAAGAVKVYRDAQELLENVDSATPWKPAPPRDQPQHHQQQQGGTHAGQQRIREAAGPGQEHAHEANTAEKKTGGKDPNGLPDGSGTTKEGAGSEQGQEDGGQSFDAG